MISCYSKNLLAITSCMVLITGCVKIVQNPEVNKQTIEFLASNNIETGYSRTFICADTIYGWTKKYDEIDWYWSEIGIRVRNPFTLSLKDNLLTTLNENEAAVIDSRNPKRLTYANPSVSALGNTPIKIGLELSSEIGRTEYQRVYLQQHVRCDSTCSSYIYNWKPVVEKSLDPNECAGKRIVYYKKFEEIHSTKASTPNVPEINISKPIQNKNSKNQPANKAQSDPKARLSALKILLDKGLITKEDYEIKKREILNQL